MTKKGRKDVEHEYLRLQHDVATNEFYQTDLTNRTNVYTCKNGHLTKTRDVDPGVTPMFYSCETCGESATSSFYRDTHPELEPTQEWFRPTLEQVLKMDIGMREHVLQGGLDIRKIQK